MRIFLQNNFGLRMIHENVSALPYHELDQLLQIGHVIFVDEHKISHYTGKRQRDGVYEGYAVSMNNVLQK